MTKIVFTEAHSKTVSLSFEASEKLAEIQSPYQKIEVYQSLELGKFFCLDGYLMITEKDEFIYHDMIVHVPMAVNLNIQNVLVIGAGDGGTVRELCRYAHISQIDMVEIDQMVVKVCQEYFPKMTASLKDPRVHLYFEDGLKFVQTKKHVYDLIIVDSTDPFSVGEGLFTQAFYQDCYEALSAQGILVNQHESPFYEAYALNMQRAHKRLVETFPIAKVYQAFIPTYASGHWLFGFASKSFDPIHDFKPDAWLELKLKTKYYNVDLHRASFALPTYVQEKLEEGLK